MKIGVFDSGVGGLSVAQTIEAALPEHEVVFVNDTEHVPYGLRQPSELLELVTPIFESMITNGCQVIVVACNTVSTVLIEQLRERFSVPFVALEPMVKPAAEVSKSRIIAVCATPATLASARYGWLKQQYAADCTILEPDCSRWAYLIEHDQINRDIIARTVQEVIEQGADVIVLGCTHYHWIETQIREIADQRAIILQPEQAVLQQLKRVLEQLA